MNGLKNELLMLFVIFFPIISSEEEIRCAQFQKTVLV